MSQTNFVIDDRQCPKYSSVHDKRVMKLFRKVGHRSAFSCELPVTSDISKTIFPASIYLFNVNNENTTIMRKRCSKLTYGFCVSSINFKQVNAGWDCVV